MKKILIILMFLVFLPCFAGEIPKQLRSQYKNEVEVYARSNLETIKKSVDYEYKKVKFIPSDSAEGRNEQIYYLEGVQGNIDKHLFYFYLNLVDITDKYIKIKQQIPIVEDSIGAAQFIYPYLKDNNVNLENISKIEDYIYNKIETIEVFLEKLRKD